MKVKGFSALTLLSLALCGCGGNKKDDNVVSQRYIHKYGYAVSQEEWEARKCPGQVVTYLSNGVTVTATYEDGVKHGPMTQTYPHSQTVEKYFLYNQGNKVKEISYDLSGVPVEEWLQLSPTRYTLTRWYGEGSPMSVEEYAGEELVEGQYYTLSNEVESRVEKGVGQRVWRDRQGTLLAKDVVEGGYFIKKETFYPSGAPETIGYYFHNTLHGEKKAFTANGEPLFIEEFVGGELHGRSTYFENGTRYAEVAYLYGQKNGLEKHFTDGNKVSEEIAWFNGKKHGLSIFYGEGKPEHQWFYSGEAVSKRKFDELNQIDEMISQLPYSQENLRK